MSNFTLTHEFNCTPDVFWKMFLDKDFSVALYKALGFPHWEVLEERETDTEIIRKVSGQPKMNMPAPVAKLLGPNFRYLEDGRMDKATKVWTWKMTPSVLADKMKQEGKFRIDPVGTDRCRRTTDLVNEAKIFGIGGLLESAAEKQLRDGWEESAVFITNWLKTHAY